MLIIIFLTDNGYIYRQNSPGNTETCVLKDLDVNVQEKEVSRSLPQVSCDRNDINITDVELLINEVSKRPILYNHHLSLQVRAPKHRNDAWKDVCKNLNS